MEQATIDAIASMMTSFFNDMIPIFGIMGATGFLFALLSIALIDLPLRIVQIFRSGGRG